MKRGHGATLNDFKDGQVDIWHWNVNGISACISRCDWPGFFKENGPTILCLNETKLQYKNLDSKKVFENIPKCYD